MHGCDLLVVGSANADLVVGVDRRPEPGETVLGSDLAVHAGGKGANQAVAAARLGARTALLARVGDDPHGRLLLGSLESAGVDTAGVLTGDAPTGVALITVDPSGDNSIVVSPGANARLTPDDVRDAGELLAAARVVSLQLEIPPATVAAAVRAAAEAGTRVVLNPSPPAPVPGDVLAACDPLVVNEHEARFLLRGHAAAGEGSASEASTPEASTPEASTPEASTPEDWAAALLDRGPRSVVVTLGPEGALVARPEGTVRVPSLSVDPVDTTGAGDAFTGALAWRLGAGDDLEAAVRFAVRVGAAAVTRPGAQESFPTESEVAEVVRALAEGGTCEPSGHPDDVSGPAGGERR
ncbi:ribokinase [Streptomyces sp. NPDC002055]|uniref:ribokinase n=1 Tax=Streptomyces sp. NPDC002055 TaxID=3154534 RepID=UPI0033338F13